MKTNLVRQAAQQIRRRMDEAVMKQLNKLVCYDESYISRLAAFTGKSYNEALEMLNKEVSDE